MSSRQGVKRGYAHFQLEELTRNQAQQSRGREGGCELHDGGMVTIRNQRGAMGSRRRGRPRKPLMLHPPSVNSEVFYVPSVNRGHFHLRTPTARPPSGALSQLPLRPCSSMDMGRQMYQPLRGGMVPQFAEMQPAPKPMLAVEALKAAQNQESIPEDLRRLADEWDVLPENNTREIVKWLYMPLNSRPPRSVTRIHEVLDEWSAPWETKVDQITDWLFDRPETREHKEVGPKVVVEKHTQLFDGWSSMQEHRSF